MDNAGRRPGPKGDPDIVPPARERATGHWRAKDEARVREDVARMTGRSIDEVAEPLSHLLHSLRYRHWEDVPGMVITDPDELPEVDEAA